MGYSVNRIPDRYSRFITSVPTIYSTENISSIVADANIEKNSGFGSLKASVVNTSVIRFNQDVQIDGLKYRVGEPETTLEDYEDYIECFVWVKSEVAMTVSLQVALIHDIPVTDTTPDYSTPRSIRLSSGAWYLLRSTPVYVDDNENYTISFSLTVSQSESITESPLYVSFPCVIGQNDFANNLALYDVVRRLPTVIRDSDVGMEYPTDPLLRFIDVALNRRDNLVELYNNIIYSDISEGYKPSDLTTHSQMVSNDATTRQFIFWLAQFIGGNLENPVATSTPWQNLPVTWQGIDAIDVVVDTNDTVGWEDLETFNANIIGVQQYFNWQIANRYYGNAAGSKKAIIETVKRILSGTKTVEYTVDTTLWKINIRTLISETPYSELLSAGDSVTEVLEVLSHTKPAGFTVHHQLAVTL